ncbi:hypothetical protein [Streptomyces sp. NPDC002758]
MDLDHALVEYRPAVKRRRSTARTRVFTQDRVAADGLRRAELRTACRELGLGYVVGVRSNHQVTTPATKLSATKAAARLPKRAWQRMRTGAGQKGVRDYDWAMIEVTTDDTPDGHDRDAGTSVLLVRRHRYTRTVPTTAASPRAW